MADFFVVEGKSKENQKVQKVLGCAPSLAQWISIFFGDCHPGAFVIFCDHVTCRTHETYRVFLETAQ